MAFDGNMKPGPALIFVTTPARDHMPLFTLPDLARQTVLQLGRAATEEDAGVAGYCLMPSCLYALLAFPEKYDLPGFMYNFKWLSSRAIFGLDHGPFHERLFRKDKFKPWMNRFDQLIISTGDQFRSRLDYMHREPVKKGLVNDPIAWEFSSGPDWIAGKPGLIKVVREIPWIN